jgi:hypothetical protein
MYFSINSNFRASKLGLFVILFLRLSSYIPNIKKNSIAQKTHKKLKL